jgi:exopolysaccharide production protein ExoZ
MKQRTARAGFFSRFDLDSGGARIPAMEGLRAYAVGLTFCVHFFGAWLLYLRHVDGAATTPAALPRITDRIFVWLQFSQYGVYLFFILSGFLICRLVLDSRSFSYPRFLWRRFLRIYPAFFIALVLATVVFMFHAGDRITLQTFVANMAFLNGIRELKVVPIIHPSWSLFFEVAFYILFPVIALLPLARLWRSPAGIVLFGLAFVYVPWWLGWGQAMFLLFFAGATLARFDDATLRSFARRMPAVVVLVAYFAVTTTIAFKWVDDHVAIWLYALAGSLLMIEVCFGDGWLTRVFAWQPMRRLGNISYSMFLVHVIPIYFMVVYGPRVFSSTGLLPAAIGFAIILAASLALSALLFLVAERPYFDAQQRRHAAPQLRGQAPRPPAESDPA